MGFLQRCNRINTESYDVVFRKKKMFEVKTEDYYSFINFLTKTSESVCIFNR